MRCFGFGRNGEARFFRRLAVLHGIDIFFGGCLARNLLLQVAFARSSHLSRFGEQVALGDGQRREVLGVEVLVVLVGEGGADELQVGVADDDAVGLSYLLHHARRVVELACILVRLVEASESAELHLVQTFYLADFYVEVAHDEMGEIELRHLEQQFVLVDGVGMIDQQELEVCYAVGGELACLYAIAVVEYGRPSGPHVFQVEFCSSQPFAGIHTVDNHARHLADATLREFLHDRLHVGYTPVGIAVVEFAQTADEQELVAVSSQGESCFRYANVAAHFAVAVFLERFVGSRIKRVFYVYAKLRVFLEVGVVEDGCPLAFGIFLFQQTDIVVGGGWFSLARIEQEQVVVHIVHLLVVGIVVGKPAQVLLAQGEVVQLVFEDDTRMVQAVFQYLVAGCHLVFRERNLCQVVFAFVRVVHGTVCRLCQGVLLGFHRCYRVALCFRQLRHLTIRARFAHHRLVHALPVVGILALAPLAFEGGFTLTHRHRVIEIPQPV